MSAPPDRKPLVPGMDTPEPIPGSRGGHRSGFDASDAIPVDFLGNTAAPALARLAVAVDAKTLQAAVAQRQKVVLLFVKGTHLEPRATGTHRIKGGSVEIH